MKFKTNAIIGLIFLGLLGFVYFYEIIGGDQRRQEAEKSKRLLDFTEGHVRRLALGRGDTSIVLQKGTDGWRLSSPVVDRADQEAVERYLRNLGESEREKTVVDNASVTGVPALSDTKTWWLARPGSGWERSKRSAAVRIPSSDISSSA